MRATASSGPAYLPALHRSDQLRPQRIGISQGRSQVVGSRAANLQVALQLRLGPGRPDHPPDRGSVVTGGEDQRVADIGGARREPGQSAGWGVAQPPHESGGLGAVGAPARHRGDLVYAVSPGEFVEHVGYRTALLFALI